MDPGLMISTMTHKSNGSFKEIEVIPSAFKPNLNPKRLENVLFDPVKRRLWRTSQIERF